MGSLLESKNVYQSIEGIDMSKRDKAMAKARMRKADAIASALRNVLDRLAHGVRLVLEKSAHAYGPTL